MDSSEYKELISGISPQLTNDTRLKSFGHKQFGKENLWEGASGFLHQIDASLHNDRDVLLIECKYWKDKVRAIEFLAHYARILDIKRNQKNEGLNIRGAIVTTKGWQSGVEKLVRHYQEECSIFVVNDTKEFGEKVHMHFIKIASIKSEEAFGHPTIKHS